MHAATINTGRVNGRTVRKFFKTYSIAIIFIAICIVFSVLNEFFLTWGNWYNILRQASINGILAIGATFVILTKGIDLSVGSVAALAGVFAGSLVTASNDMGVPVAILCGIGAGVGAGLVNGTLICRFSVPPFVATLGMLSVARGLTFIYSDGQPIPNLSESFRYLGSGEIAGIPLPVVVLAGVFLVGWVILTFTPYGRYVYAVGGNERAARVSGVPIKRVVTFAYVIAGVLAALGGLILAARTTAALPQAGVSYELDAIAAVVIGGTSLAGGRGTLVGTLFGALIIGTINNGLDILGVSSYYQQVIKGCIIVISVMVDMSWNKSRN